MQLEGFFACAEPQSYWLRHPVVHLKDKRETNETHPLSERMRLACTSLTCAVTVIILIIEHLIQNEAEQLCLQRGVWCEDQRLQVFPPRRHDLVTEDQQQIT